jgi:signal transduction histidine kinase
MIDKTIASVRRLATDLRPQILDELGMVEAMRWQIEEFRQLTGIVCTVDLPDEPIDCAPDRATAMFRILQESLTNVVRHAGATRAGVRLTCQDERIVLEVSDDGQGITEDQLEHSRSFGLLGMQERARMFGGVLRIEAGEERGTTVVVSMPY